MNSSNIHNLISHIFLNTLVFSAGYTLHNEIPSTVIKFALYLTGTTYILITIIEITRLYHKNKKVKSNYNKPNKD